MAARAKYNRKAIDRAFKFHQANAEPTYRYHGYDEEGDVFRVAMVDEVFALTPREAWIASFALAVGRAAGKRAAAAAAVEEASR